MKYYAGWKLVSIFRQTAHIKLFIGCQFLAREPAFKVILVLKDSVSIRWRER